MKMLLTGQMTVESLHSNLLIFAFETWRELLSAIDIYVYTQDHLKLILNAAN